MGRKRIGKKKTYRINDTIYKEFKLWCKANDMSVSEAVRKLMKEAYIRDLVKQLKKEM